MKKQARTPEGHPKWEYHWSHRPTMFELKILGSEGWEMVNAMILDGQLSTFFKRPLMEEGEEE